MAERQMKSRKVNGKPFAYVNDNKADHLGGDWTNPVEPLIERNVTDEE